MKLFLLCYDLTDSIYESFKNDITRVVEKVVLKISDKKWYRGRGYMLIVTSSLKIFFARFYSGRQQRKDLLQNYLICCDIMLNKWCAVMNTCILLVLESTFGRRLQPFKKYLRKTLVLMWNSALREKFIFYFSEVFC